MRDLIEIANECMCELEEIGIEIGTVTRFKVNTRARRRWGQCRLTYDSMYSWRYNEYEININVDLLDERNSLEGLKEVIFHELLHTCRGCMNHGDEWQRLAETVNNAYGYNIKRCSSARDVGVSYSRPVAEVKPKYVFKCNECGGVVKQKRASKFTKHPEYYSCGRCGGKFTKII